MIRTKAPQLLVKMLLHLGGILHHIVRELGCDVDLITESALFHYAAEYILDTRIYVGHIIVVNAHFN